eukprot:550480-Ditylum_brightwellii.AAC.2
MIPQILKQGTAIIVVKKEAQRKITFPPNVCILVLHEHKAGVEDKAEHAAVEEKEETVEAGWEIMVWDRRSLAHDKGSCTSRLSVE